MATSPAGVVWRGQDGNIYTKNAGIGVQNEGSGAGISDAQLGTMYANTSLIADPTLPVSTPNAPSSAPTHPALNTGAVHNTQIAIDQLPAILANALSSEDQTYGNTINQFGAQEQQQRGQYDTSSTTNQQNYDSNFMDSIRAGVKGLGGLMNILRGTGAAGGTAEQQVHDVVGDTTANDIRTGHDTQQANQGALDASLGQFLTDLKGKRQTADDTHANNRMAIQRDNATQLQDLFGKMAGFYGDAGNTATANDWLGRAGSLTPQIAQNSRTQVGNYDVAPVAVHAPQVTAFAAPSQPNVAIAPQDGQVGSGIFTMNRGKKDDTAPSAAVTPTAAPVGA